MDHKPAPSSTCKTVEVTFLPAIVRKLNPTTEEIDAFFKTCFQPFGHIVAYKKVEELPHYEVIRVVLDSHRAAVDAVQHRYMHVKGVPSFGRIVWVEDWTESIEEDLKKDGRRLMKLS